MSYATTTKHREKRIWKHWKKRKKLRKGKKQTSNKTIKVQRRIVNCSNLFSGEEFWLLKIQDRRNALTPFRMGLVSDTFFYSFSHFQFWIFKIQKGLYNSRYVYKLLISMMPIHDLTSLSRAFIPIDYTSISYVNVHVFLSFFIFCPKGVCFHYQ